MAITKFGKITQNKSHFAVQGHSRSLILVPIESSYTTIRGKICRPQSRNCQNRILHISEIGNLLPVCLRNNVHLADHISEPYAEFFLENGKELRT